MKNCFKTARFNSHLIRIFCTFCKALHSSSFTIWLEKLFSFAVDVFVWLIVSTVRYLCHSCQFFLPLSINSIIRKQSSPTNKHVRLWSSMFPTKDELSFQKMSSPFWNVSSTFKRSTFFYHILAYNWKIKTENWITIDIL